MKLNIITFGKAAVTPINEGEAFEFECQNGPTECLGNKIMSCVVAFFPIEIQLPFLSCLLSSPSLIKNTKECGKKLSVPTAAIEECSTGIEGSRILYENGLKTLKLQPKLFFVPTVTVNKFYNSSLLHESLKNFPDFICDSYIRSSISSYDISTPVGCRVKLDVYIDSLNPRVQKFFLEQLTPTWRRIGRSIDLTIIPYLNPQNISDSDTDIIESNGMSCPGGPLECYGNTVISCIVELIPIQEQIDMFVCMFRQRMSSMKGQECARQEGIDWEPINDCVEGFLGKSLVETNRLRTVKLFPHSKEVPSITINGITNSTLNDWATEDLNAMICDTFLTSNRPPHNQVSLPSGCPVRVELYIEMLCPDTRKFFLTKFYPAWKGISALVDLHIFPFGKANVWLTESGDDYQFECQHGPTECEGNKIMSCVVEYLPVDLQVEFIACMMNDDSPTSSGNKCATELEVAWEPLEVCKTSKEGSKLLFRNGIQTMNLNPTLTFVPTVTINGFYSREQLDHSLNHLEEQVCEVYQGPFSHTNKVLTPKGCRLVVEVYFIMYSDNSRRFITNQLLPVWQKLQAVIHLELIPVGIVSKDGNKEMNLEEVCPKNVECSADLMFACVKKHTDIQTQMKFLECVLSKSNTSLDAGKQCSQKMHISWNMISKCIRSPKGYDLLHQGQMRAKSLRPSFHGVPTVTLNGFYDKQDLKKSKENLLEMVCNSFYDPSELTSKKWKPNGCPVTVEIYMEALCPDMTKYFVNQVVPALKALSSIMNLHMIPFGKASGKAINSDKTEYEFQCQNGPLECQGNKIMSCVIEHYSPDDQVKMLTCMFTRKHPAVEEKECAEELGLNWSRIADCVNKEGSELLYKNGLLTQKVKPRIFFIPTTTINGFYNKMILRQSLRDLSGLVCEFYLQGQRENDEAPIPAGCRVAVDVYFQDLDDGMKLLFSNEIEEFWRIYKRIIRLNFLPLKSDVSEQFPTGNSQPEMFSCITKTLSTEDQLKFFACLMFHDEVELAYEKCSQELNVNLEGIKFCATSSKSSEILYENQSRYQKFRKPLRSSPTVIVHKTVVRQHNDIRKLTCAAYKGPTPNECKNL